jgi:membrane-bound lytic murein transglycosylase D
MKKITLVLLFLGITHSLLSDIIHSVSVQHNYGLIKKDSTLIPELGKKDILESTEDLSALRIPHVREWVYNYLMKYPSAVSRASRNAKYYRAFVMDVFSSNPAFPQILSDLPILESSYNPKARSHAGAVGLWQFMPQTARGLNMSIDSWSDERQNLIISTQSAILHLQHLKQRHGQWEMALAAYNCGSGRVDTAVKKYPGATYWDLVDMKALPDETLTYVQKFSALSIINSNRELFGLEEQTYNSYKMKYVELKYPVALKDLAQYSGTNIDVIRFFNPQLRKSTTPLLQKNYSVLLPAMNAATLSRNENKLYSLRFNVIKKHKVKKGEYLGKIAEKYNVPMQYIIAINTLKKPYKLYPGKTLYIPVL